MNMLTPEKYLEEHGIDLKATSLISYIDGAMRQPNLVELMRGYHLAKQAEEDSLEADISEAKKILQGGDQADGKNSHS